MMSGTVLSAVRATYVHSTVPARPYALPVGRGRQFRRAKGVAIRASNVQEPQANAWDADEETHNEMSAEVLEGLKERFVKADTDKSGMIDKTELQALLESTGSGQEYLTEHWLTEEEIEKVMEQYDRDGNGLIDFNEFIQLAQDGVLLEGKLSEYRQAFDAVDTSSNGTIGANELAQLFSDLDQPLTFDKLASIFQAYDKDASGQIEFGEFLRMFRSHLLDLNEVLNYIKTQPRASDLATSSGSLVEPGAGEVTLIFSEQELDDALAIHHAGLTVLFAGLTWCRPCKGVQKPFVNLAERYMDVRFLKFFGNANDNTKNLFKNRLKIRATPSFCFFREGQLVHAMSGANKSKLETQLRLLLKEEELAEPLYAGHPTAGKLGSYS